jgi:hypothetical protein
VQIGRLVLSPHPRLKKPLLSAAFVFGACAMADDGDNSTVSRPRKAILVVVGVLAVIVMLAGLAFGTVAYGQASEAAMTSCGGVPSNVRKGATGVTVESRLLPWKFTCVFHDRSGRVVARAPAPYDPPWHNLLP